MKARFRRAFFCFKKKSPTFNDLRQKLAKKTGIFFYILTLNLSISKL